MVKRLVISTQAKWRLKEHGPASVENLVAELSRLIQGD
jgi:hypothetical protein